MVVRPEQIQEALEKTLDISPVEASDTALRVLNYFGFNSVIIDNALHQEDRKVFYDLHDAGLLNTYWETVILPTGRSWRTFYWELDELAIDRARRRQDDRTEEKVYETLPEEIWARIET